MTQDEIEPVVLNGVDVVSCVYIIAIFLSLSTPQSAAVVVKHLSVIEIAFSGICRI